MKRKGFNVVKTVKGNEEVLGFDELETAKTKVRPNQINKFTESQEAKVSKKARYPKLNCAIIQNPLPTQKLSIVKLVEDIFINEEHGLKGYFNSLSMQRDRKIEILDTLTEVLRSTSNAIEDTCPDNASFAPEIQSVHNSDNTLSLRGDINKLIDTLDMLTKFENEMDILLKSAANFESDDSSSNRSNIINDQASNYLSILKGMNENCEDVIHLLSSADDNITKTTNARSQLFNAYQMANSDNSYTKSSSTKEIVKALQKT